MVSAGTIAIKRSTYIYNESKAYDYVESFAKHTANLVYLSKRFIAVSLVSVNISIVIALNKLSSNDMSRVNFNIEKDAKALHSKLSPKVIEDLYKIVPDYEEGMHLLSVLRNKMNLLERLVLSKQKIHFMERIYTYLYELALALHSIENDDLDDIAKTKAELTELVHKLESDKIACLLTS